MRIEGEIMLREILRLSSNNFTVSISNEYINQEIELIMLSLKKGN